MGLCSLGCLVSALALHGPAAPIAAHAIGSPARELIEVVSPSDPSQRYVVYVPGATDPGAPRPILYIMDYRGRARVAAEVFRPAAERLGWILMSSYNTVSDGEAAPNAVALKTMWRDSHDRFAIDDRRTYLAGLSGTARMATLVAARAGAGIAGVIGAAAGFHPDVAPSKDMPFAYYGTAGTADYNYWEMAGVEMRLSRLGLPHRVAFFDGPHGWMPPELAEAALAWMDLRAMLSGHCGVDPALVDERWARDRARVSALESAGLDWEASRLLAAMVNDYASLRTAEEIAGLGRRARQLGATAAATAQARRHVRASAEHDGHVRRALQVIADAYPAEAEASLATVAETVRDLEIARLHRAAAGVDVERSLAARRVLAQLDVQAGFYLPLNAIRAGQVGRASFYLAIAEAINPNDGYAWYLRGAVEARSGRPDRALLALERAIALGFRTADALEHDAAFKGMRRRPEFARLVNGLRAATR